ncbi:hypothetical protein RND64_13160 [Gordonia sp. w5E2]|nr:MULTISPECIES: hypothetical protein [Gordonia]
MSAVNRFTRRHCSYDAAMLIEIATTGDLGGYASWGGVDVFGIVV